MTRRHINAAGLQIIKDAEGLRLVAYKDTGGVWTIGYGHTGPEVKRGLRITAERAEELLREDVREAEEAVERLFPKTTANQFSALASFVFNLGEGRVAKSTLRRLHNAESYRAAGAQFGRWVYDNGVKLNGLVKRRAAERELYSR